MHSENVLVSGYQASGACGHDVHLHRDSYCCCLCAGECAGGAGCVCEPGSPQHHLLLHRVSGRGWHRCGSFGHPSGYYHQSGIQHSVLHLPLPLLPAADHHPELHPLPAGHRHRPISARQDSHQVRNCSLLWKVSFGFLRIVTQTDWNKVEISMVKILLDSECCDLTF